MKSQDLILKFKSHPIPFAAGFIILVSLMAFYLRMGIVGDLEVTYEEVSSQGKLVSDNLLAGGRMEEDLEALDGLVKKIESRLVKPVELAKNLQYFYRLEAETGVKVVGLQQKRIPEQPTKGMSYIGVGYSVDLTGRFSALISYLRKLEQGSSFCRINKFAINNTIRGSQGSVTAAVEVELLGIQ